MDADAALPGVIIAIAIIASCFSIIVWTLTRG